MITEIKIYPMNIKKCSATFTEHGDLWICNQLLALSRAHKKCESEQNGINYDYFRHWHVLYAIWKLSNENGLNITFSKNKKSKKSHTDKIHFTKKTIGAK